MKAERVVLDTNVLIGAALRANGPPRAVIETLRSADGCLVTGDRDLLAMYPFQGVPILSPVDFLGSRTDRRP